MACIPLDRSLLESMALLLGQPYDVKTRSRLRPAVVAIRVSCLPRLGLLFGGVDGPDEEEKARRARSWLSQSRATSSPEDPGGS
jgi:hypothetical protein